MVEMPICTGSHFLRNGIIYWDYLLLKYPKMLKIFKVTKILTWLEAGGSLILFGASLLSGDRTAHLSEGKSIGLTFSEVLG